MEGSFRDRGAAKVSRDERTVTVHVPLTFRRKGGRKVVISPTGELQRPARARYIDDALLRSLVQAFEWKRMLDEGECVSVSELAGATKLNHSFVSRVLRLTLLAPDVVEAILDGSQGTLVQRQAFLRGLPHRWAEQLP
ncbi:hypothetical protein KEU06_28135 [Pseudaminobacter sp. 19-2017]|uniref:LacI family transcriptional regulator n=1 Tax=Pseudaminobacter soli (ex Zhang et al. 2022) TaxID=2831468 RepID=A0A942IBM8_9HYPH|nr:hypothetical protein [Pseudaminobacter soli]MBS3652460.1 hypothetical protein [Pseudaminobacter soli]